MQTVTTVGLDIAKSVFQVHGIDAKGDVVIRRQLKRRYVLAFFQKLPSCLVGIEACASSHHWSRELTALGHTVRLMPPAYVKPYVKRQKNDMADAEAICEAVTRATMRFVPTKTPEQQSCLMLHRTRHLFIRQQTAVINAIRAHLAEFGIVAPLGRRGVEELLGVVADPKDKRLPDIARACLAALGAQLRVLKKQNVSNPSSSGEFVAVQSVAHLLGVEVRPINVGDAGEIERAVAAFARSANGGLIVTGSASASVHRDLIIALAAQHRLPAVFTIRHSVTSGGLISYGPDRVEQFRRAAGYVDRILKGEKPADLPVMQPTKFELVININERFPMGT
jgi:hypothetical protein